MSVTILTTSFKRPLLLKRLADVVVPLVNKLNGKLKWRIAVDEITDEYEFVFKEIQENTKKIDLITWSYHQNIGKYRSLSKIFNENHDTEWLVNIDDDDILINFKFEQILIKLNSLDMSINSILFPRLVLNQKFYHYLFKKKQKLFLKFNKTKISYFEYKDQFGDFDSTIFIRKNFYQEETFDEVENDKFTPESLRWLVLFPKKDIFLVNDNLIYSQYLYDGITNFTDKNRISNYKSAMITYKKFLDYKEFSISKIFIKSLINYYRFSMHGKIKNKIFQYNYGNLYVHVFCLLLAKLLFFKDIIFTRKNQ